MSNRKLTALALLSLGFCAASAAVALGNSGAPHRGASAGIAFLTGASLLGVGLYAWNSGSQVRFGRVLFATGLCWFFASWSNSDISFLYTVGRIAGWVFEAVLIYALASYPTGRLETRGARLICAAAALTVVFLYLPTIPLVKQYPLPTTFTACVEHCPGNAFFLGSDPGFIDSAVMPVREILTLAIFASVAGLLAVRLRAAGRNLKRTLVPVLGAAILRFGAASAYIAMRRAGADTDVLEVARLVVLLTVPAIVFGFLVGLLQWRVYSARALATLTNGLAAVRSPAAMRDLLAESMAEPVVELYYVPAGENDWHDSAGRSCPAPLMSGTMGVTEAQAASGLRVAIACDRGYSDHPDFLGSLSACVISDLERQRLDAALTESLASVAASRKRLASAADDARRKIERDLHDGAQQQLVALRVKLELAREALEGDGEGAAALVAGLGPEVDEIIGEVRSLARGIYPPLLASDGLGEALRAAGRRSSLPVAINADGVERLPSETESAVYFCCLEALQNAAKHAAGATQVTIELRDQGSLDFEVADDGCGFCVEEIGEGSGVIGMRDRLAAVGGRLWIESDPGIGTRVHGRVTQV